MPELGKEADRSRKPAPGDRPTPAQSAQPHSHSAFIFQSRPHPGKPPTPAKCVRPRLPLPTPRMFLRLLALCSAPPNLPEGSRSSRKTF